MAGGGGSGTSLPTPTTRERRQTTAWLPLDMVADIAARTDPVTLVRCAAMCVDMRPRVKDYIGVHGRLHLRHSDHFVPPLLRGHLIHMYMDHDMFLVDTTAVDATTLGKATGVYGFPLASYNGLVLTRVARKLCVWDPATGQSQTLPSELTFPVGVVGRTQYCAMTNYVLLVGDDDDEGATALGRQFRVVMAYLELSQYHRYVHFQTFSSADGAWGRYTKIRAHKLQGRNLERRLDRALVVGDVAHWLCLTDKGDYVLKLHVRVSQVTVTLLPESLPHGRLSHKLLATSSAGGGLVVLVADGEKVSAWAQSKQTAKLQPRQRVVIETEAILQLLDEAGVRRPPPTPCPVMLEVKLLWFAERSGTVLINVLKNMSTIGYFWLDLRSSKIGRWFSDPRVEYGNANMPYEMNLVAWVPTFSSTL